MLAPQGHRHNIPLRELLQRMADLLHDMAGAGAAIEDRVGDEILSGNMDPQGLKQSLQGLDQLVQMVAELGLFLERIAPEIEREHLLDVSDAAQRLRLREMAAALFGAAVVGKFPNGATGLTAALPGEVDMF